LDVHALFQNIGTQATKRYFLPRLGRVAYFSRYKVGLSDLILRRGERRKGERRKLLNSMV
ncbi:hypothetical protein, partial [Microcystis aeruginosa]|uniref:hypothetical protein n=1 Tax=Microcystis aeruginosa TaxID=1126 RepID=UPI001B8CE236